MFSIVQHPFTRLVDIRNRTGVAILDVRVHYSTEGSGDGTWRVADRMEPDAGATWSLAAVRKRLRSVTVSYRLEDVPGTVRTGVLRAPARAYFRWLKADLRADRQLGGIGRAQGMPGPAYPVSAFLAEPDDDIPADAPPVAETVLQAEGARARTHFVEVVNFAPSPLRLRAIAVVDTSGDAYEVQSDAVLRRGGFVDCEFAGAEGAGIARLKLSFEHDGGVQAAEADFTRFGHASLRYGTVMWEGEAGELGWVGLADWGDAVGALPAAPDVRIELDPAPQFPDAFCAAPMRLFNAGTRIAHVRYSETFWNEGPAHLCNASPSVSFHECTLAPGGWLPLGCSRYQSPNMLCSWNRRWELIGALGLS